MRKTEALLALGLALVIGGSDAAAQSGGRHIRIRKDMGTNPGAMDTTASLNNGAMDTTASLNNGASDTTTTEYAGGEVALAPTALPPGMTDANILAHLASSDSLEIRMAQLALTRAQDPRVRNLAQMILDDHSRNLQQGQALAQRNGITPAPAPGDTAAQRMMRMMDRMSSMSGTMGARFDTMFVRRQVMLHQRTLDQLQQLRNVAQSGAVRQQLDATIPVIEKHLDAAQQLAREMGISTSDMGNMRGMRGRNGMTGGSYMRDSTTMPSPNTPTDTTTPNGRRNPGDTTGVNTPGTMSPNGTGTVNGTNGANYPNGTTNTTGMPVAPGSNGTNGTTPPNGSTPTGTRSPNGTNTPGTVPAPGTPGSASTRTGTKPPTF